KLAPGGGYCFCGGFLGRLGDDKTLQKNRMVRRAAEELGHLYY
ncbi:MAG: veratrol--corrinoid protein metyltransferase, partial [Parasporobacterium sp.]|nr:veratrol--corrinoid protein metyltransferase [Parasporobacterium sp.]